MNRRSANPLWKEKKLWKTKLYMSNKGSFPWAAYATPFPASPLCASHCHSLSFWVQFYRPIQQRKPDSAVPWTSHKAVRSPRHKRHTALVKGQYWLRNYFFLRRHIGNDYLDLLRFFLNHRRFMRSERIERVGKSPAELLTGKQHSHWLELLGFERFSRN